MKLSQDVTLKEKRDEIEGDLPLIRVENLHNGGQMNPTSPMHAQFNDFDFTPKSNLCRDFGFLNEQMSSRTSSF